LLLAGFAAGVLVLAGAGWLGHKVFRSRSNDPNPGSTANGSPDGNPATDQQPEDDTPRWVPMSEEMQGQVARLAGEIAEVLRARKEKSVSLGQFTSPPQLACGAGPGIGQALAAELQRLGIAVERRARLGIQGSYSILNLEEGKGSKHAPLSARLLVEVVDSSGAVVSSGGQPARFTSTIRFADPERPAPKNPSLADVDGARTLSALFAVTAVLPADGSVPERHRQIRAALRNPTARIEGTRVFAGPESPYAVEVVVANRPRQPVLEEGLAFVPLKRDETYAVRLVNQSEHDCAVTLTIDGLNLFTFSDQRAYSHVIVPARSSGLLRGWHRSNERSDAFQVTRYSRSAAAGRLKNTAATGTITATFAAAWPKNGAPPPDENAMTRGQEPDATGRGPAVRQRYEEVERHVGLIRASISIRYSKADR
jgi:hypothetical protein